MMILSLNTQTVLAGLAIGLLVYYVIKRMRYRLPPGPWCIPLVGHYKVYTAADIHKKFYEISKVYGPVVRLSFGPIPVIVLNDIEVVLEAMVKKKADFAGRPKIKSGEVFSGGSKDIALSNYSPTWKCHRRVAGKALRYYLQGDLLEQMIQDNMNKFLDEMAREKDSFAFKDYVDLMVFHQLYTICFGEKRPVDDEEVKAILQLDTELNDYLAKGFLEDIIPYMERIYPTRQWQMFVNKMKQFFNFIREKFIQHKDTFDTGVRRDFIDSMLIARQEAENEGDEAVLEKLDDAYLIHTVADIFLAGVDTTRFTMDWFVYFMTRFPDIQSKCQEEIDREVGSERPSMKHRNKLHFLEACMFETMRLGGVVGIGVPHMSICDSQIGGYDIPKSTMVIINHWGLHHDPKYWKDPETFDPYRYLDENGEMKPAKPDSWLPFSAGRRVCLGEAVAKPEILLMCANLLQRFDIRLPDGVKPNLEYHILGFGVELPSEYKIVVQERIGN
ncbi:steroid 17-alpha-hydroxylase/17,20 lyase-like [Ostrea edulis]|uniref:steroid 17-alpha-hydroxylase/17,20 lyase-like n=1 Tax=Ostrea edulis TaxID=37623 RepID=UPI002095CA27|nr:steroid 17-alpha-hydroxylase/17,20 lyase-like [Ostrea edulis]XP_048758700.1 steroid 17-alpha-hydroxylase/17,20 lyase-like [Ostrea edulis]XP_048758701.1 steroid 17-alpha-hydroxylase/17,20 lyase-like [Ostrea edulis]XP_048758702.1 steroid 17-alpha-hydroxylase/17,20 lyase-like [Ostrea edulis]XP_048758703.1 steroid 17-alpha-hydroxylase/17,20 lyase-like [Ostrea edulis]